MWLCWMARKREASYMNFVIRAYTSASFKSGWDIEQEGRKEMIKKTVT